MPSTTNDNPPDTLRVPAPATSTASTDDAASLGRVLVVDDDEANRESLTRRLQRRGYTVTSAGDGAAALAAIDAAEFDVVVLDVMMPGISGIEVLTTVRKTRQPAELPIIMATARDATEDIVEAMELGANDYVTKPLDFAAVLARVRTNVLLCRSVREVFELERQLSQRNADLESANGKLRAAAQQTERDLKLAAKVQATFLPRELPFPDRLNVEWRYLPCQELAGDATNVCRLDDEHVGFYVLDVSGHGVAASLTAVSAARLLSPGHDPASILVGPAGVDGTRAIVSPAAVLKELSARFEWNSDISQFLTVFYAVLHLPTGRMTYASAGHPGPFLMRADGSVATLESTCLPVGVTPDPKCEEREITIARGDRLYVYSDGVIEAAMPTGDQFGMDRLAELLRSTQPHDLPASVAKVLDSLDLWRDGEPANDDVTLLGIELIEAG